MRLKIQILKPITTGHKAFGRRALCNGLQALLIVVALCGALAPGTVYAQPPFVKSMDKVSARTQETVTLQGINFGTNAASIKVILGATSVTPQKISDQLIEVSVPPGATYDNISVTNTVTGLSGYSAAPFFPSYGGENPFRMAATSAQSDNDSEDGLYDLTIADFDGDGKVDVATANDNSNNIAVFRNTTVGGTISFTKTLLPIGAKTLHVASGDLNGDGKPEILVSQVNASNIYVFKNTSTSGTISFTSSSVSLSGSKASSIRVADLDMNGKPDLVITDQAVSRVFVVPNQSTLAAISFAAPISIPVSGTSGTDGVAVADLDGDEFPEIAVSEFLNANGKLFVLKNESSPGTMNFARITTIDVPSTLSNLRIGDLDGDAKPEIAGTLLLSSRVFVLGNQCTATEIKFASAVAFDADEKPWGIDFGDVDGDGKTDIVVASITKKSVTVLNNQSTAGTFAFLTSTKTTTYINRHVRVGDLDNDGRPDIAFTSINDNNLGIKASKVSVIRNLNCVVPKITPTGPLTICAGFAQRLDASFNDGGVYNWFKDGAATGTGANFLDVTVSGIYTVTLTSDGGNCVKTSAGVTVTVVTGAPAGVATPAPVAPVCVGGTLNLSVNNVGAQSYNWTGPEGFTASGLSVSRSNFLASQAGVYRLEVIVSPNCVTQRESLVVDVVSIPDAEVLFPGTDIICTGETKLLSAFPAVTGFTYQWEEETTGPISGATNATYTATITGKYLVKLKSTASPACVPITIPAKRIRIAKNPVVNFTYPATACVGQQVDFVNTSTADNDPLDPEINYTWVFGDGQSSTAKDANHIYATAQNFNVGLTVGYRNNACAASKTQAIGLLIAPTVDVTYPAGVFGLCPSDSVLLQVTGSWPSYKWSTGATTPTILVKKAGTYSVEVPSLGCKLTASKDVVALAAPVVTATADPTSINLTESTQLGTTGLFDFFWSPGVNLSDSTVANPIATPSVTTIYKVSGVDDKACFGEAEVEVTVIPDNILTLLRPASMLTPNGDGFNDAWTVKYIEIFDQCSVTIYDERGLNVFQATPYKNDWTGISSNGRMLSAGVYYYIIRCGEPGEKPLSGSITMVR